MESARRIDVRLQEFLRRGMENVGAGRRLLVLRQSVEVCADGLVMNRVVRFGHYWLIAHSVLVQGNQIPDIPIYVVRSVFESRCSTYFVPFRILPRGAGSGSGAAI